MEVAQFHRALSDETRLRVLALLTAEGELCVCELVLALDMIQPRISRHLALLRDQGILQARRSGQWVLYSIAPDLPAWAREILRASAGAVAQTEAGKRDQARLADMHERPSRQCCA